eukprot:CAMPEP_0119112772 /NCGR_PEP_ID=MMETSP1180-20130426/41656_1 /TAXON_ID=3052 ORGANISM="Chlamydomonas cf sp, Strain CCMP681" /NCGR_SAMPLE_ID=MMETSP1180 /ASSEMBLY_ACC=CAM_ASM_000741 /LENGTH=74 /DNA_ID=CAMNT_0007100471 /DNA_START=65 /DNA_END=289 /DNA_ORIENTATION=+
MSAVNIPSVCAIRGQDLNLNATQPVQNQNLIRAKLTSTVHVYIPVTFSAHSAVSMAPGPVQLLHQAKSPKPRLD